MHTERRTAIVSIPHHAKQWLTALLYSGQTVQIITR